MLTGILCNLDLIKFIFTTHLISANKSVQTWLFARPKKSRQPIRRLLRSVKQTFTTVNSMEQLKQILLHSLEGTISESESYYNRLKHFNFISKSSSVFFSYRGNFYMEGRDCFQITGLVLATHSFQVNETRFIRSYWSFSNFTSLADWNHYKSMQYRTKW